VIARAPGSPRPRVVLIGGEPAASAGARGGLARALAARADVEFVAARSLLRDGLRAYRRAASAVTTDGFEMVHLLDAGLAPIGALLRRNHGVPVSVTVSPQVMTGKTPGAVLARRALGQLDEAFVAEPALWESVSAAAPRLAVSLSRPRATELPWPSTRDVAVVARLMRDVRPGRLVIGVPWPENRNDLRWFRDRVLPLLDGKPLCLLFGAPSRRETRLLLPGAGVRSQFRVLSGNVPGPRLAAVARWLDVVAAPAAVAEREGSPERTLALAVVGVPLLTSRGHDAALLDDEQDAFLVAPGDDRAFASTLNRVLALPAVQRHYLGEEFARHALARWNCDAAADVCVERFAALVGRPQIPVALRAA